MSIPMLAAVIIALREQSKSGPPDSYANANGDQSSDAVIARNRISEILNGGFGIQFQSSKVPADSYKNPESLDDIYERVQKMNQSAVTGVHQMWEGLRNKLQDSQKEFGPAILQAIAEKWQGGAGTKAAEGIRKYVDESQQLVASAQIVAEKVKLVRSAVEITKPAVQPGYKPTWTSDVASWVPGPTWKMNDHRRDVTTAANAHVINNVFYPAVRESDTQVPLVPRPHNPVSDPGTNAPWTPHGTSDQQGGPNGQPPDSLTSDLPSNPLEQSTSENPADTTLAGVDPSATTAFDPSKVNPTIPANADPAATTPSSTQPGSPSSSIPGGPSGPGAPSGAPPGGPGKSMPGVPGKPVAPGGGRPSTARPGAPGMGGSPGMMPPGARGKPDDEKEHKSKISEALVSQTNGDELTGQDEAHRPKTVPPVLGG
ncbi:hypothetical protein OH799_28860 [Nocardia sp. NBC_00881]|uniref:hypothetical protein n=1 Tax=Nocardia sp. NBC_00881 TaxID=2975995 RepID=UPI003870531E|nr:hypothetical protein OH799_28860 [Nocardia sp. NBC_00881]